MSREGLTSNYEVNRLLWTALIVGVFLGLIGGRFLEVLLP